MEASSRTSRPRGPSTTIALLALVAVLGSPTATAAGAGLGGALSVGVDAEPCVPHPPIRITEDHGEQGFTLGPEVEASPADPPTYRPGSGVVAGLGTEAHPFVIRNWCIDGDADWPDPLAPDQAQGIVIANTDAHVVVRDTVVTGHADHGILLADAGNVTVLNNTLADNGQPDSDGSGLAAVGVEAVGIAGNNVTGSWTQGVHVRGSAHVSIRDNAVDDSGRSGIRVSRSHEVEIHDNAVRSSQSDGLRLFDLPQPYIENNTIEDSARAGVIGWDVGEATLRGNDVSDSRSRALWLFDRSGLDGQRLTIVNNTVTASYMGLHVSGVEEVQIQDNRLVEHRNRGMSLWRLGHVELVANDVSGNGGPGVSAGSWETARVASNAFADNDGPGFDLATAGEIALRGNGVVDNGASGVEIDRTDRVRLMDNTLEGNAHSGLRVRDVDDVELVGNDVAANGHHGAKLFELNQARVLDNQVRENAWKGIIVKNGRATVADNTAAGNGQDGLLLSWGVDGSVRDNNLSDNGRHGLRMWYAGDVRVIGNALAGNAGAGLHSHALQEAALVEQNALLDNGKWGIGMTGSDGVRIRENNFEGNTQAALKALSSHAIDVRDNWWGSASGPSGGTVDGCTGAVADGEGARIDVRDERVCFDPWLTEPVDLDRPS